MTFDPVIIRSNLEVNVFAAMKYFDANNVISGNFVLISKILFFKNLLRGLIRMRFCTKSNWNSGTKYFTD